MWKIKKIVSKGDYNYAIVNNHPCATKYGYVLEHRIVMENHLNRILDSNEVVHHINGNKKDNRLENLEIMTKNAHLKLHATTGEKFLELKCPNCQNIFVRPKRNTHLSKHTKCTFCSRRCNGIFNRYVQLHGLTIEMELAISENIVREFIHLDNSEQTGNNMDA